MRVQSHFMRECLVTEFTDERPVASVIRHVISVTVLSSKVFSADFTAVRLLACVDAQVGLKSSLHGEGLAAYFATVRLLACVNAKVILQGGLPNEHLVAYVAAVDLCCVSGVIFVLYFVFVNSESMKLKVPFICKSLLTDVACIHRG